MTPTPAPKATPWPSAYALPDFPKKREKRAGLVGVVVLVLVVGVGSAAAGPLPT